MTLIKSVSGIRGTIGGIPNENLTPVDLVRLVSAYGMIISKNSSNSKIVLGRDGRISGPMLHSITANVLIGLGIDVIDVGLSTTPTVEMHVIHQNADGGIILTASHNPANWNALKFLNKDGEFLSPEVGAELLRLADSDSLEYVTIDSLGEIIKCDNALEQHIDAISNLEIIDFEKVRRKKYKAVVDGINSSGAIAVPKLLEAMGVEYELINGNIHGRFAHNPEPLEENLFQLSDEVIKQKADFGIAVDPDVDRLVLMDHKGKLFGEEYTLVACADYVLSSKIGSTVSNLSSTRALKDITLQYGAQYHASAVGEYYVVQKMKRTKAVIGGEGNGGIILPELHYGRDALVGIALFLNLLTDSKQTVQELKNNYPEYHMVKLRVPLDSSVRPDEILSQLLQIYKEDKIDKTDGLKIDFENSWAHIRKSNTEPIMRIYSEAKSFEDAECLASKIKDQISGFNVR